jgi:hypothetical protein
MPISTQDHNSLTLKSQIPNKLQIQHTKQSPQSETQQSLKLTRSIRSQTRNRNQDSTQSPPIRHALKSSTQEKTPETPKSTPQQPAFGPQFTPKPKASSSKEQKPN